MYPGGKPLDKYYEAEMMKYLYYKQKRVRIANIRLFFFVSTNFVVAKFLYFTRYMKMNTTIIYNIYI